MRSFKKQLFPTLDLGFDKPLWFFSRDGKRTFDDDEVLGADMSFSLHARPSYLFERRMTYEKGCFILKQQRQTRDEAIKNMRWAGIHLLNVAPLQQSSLVVTESAPVHALEGDQEQQRIIVALVKDDKLVEIAATGRVDEMLTALFPTVDVLRTFSILTLQGLLIESDFARPLDSFILPEFGFACFLICSTLPNASLTFDRVKDCFVLTS